MSEKRMKVVWLCHLTNNEIQNILKPRKRIGEYAPWMFISLKIAEKDPRFEIHVVAPHPYISGIKEFELRGIQYHFFNPYIPFWGRPWPYINGTSWNEISDFRKCKRRINSIIKNINPDVIHLYGAENPYYSSAIPSLAGKYPITLTVQGLAYHSVENNRRIRKCKEYEKKAVNDIQVSFYRSKTQAKDTLFLNPSLELFLNKFGSYELNYLDLPTEKKYDLVFFARICKAKGIEDLLQAVKIIKEQKHDISLCVIGGGTIDGYKEQCRKLGIEENVIWAGFQPTRKDVHFLAAQSRISVLPTYHDILPGTIQESMLLGIPMVTYDVDSNPEINEDYEAIKLVKKGDIKALANTLNELLNNADDMARLSAAGKKKAQELFVCTDEETANQWMRGYKRAIELFNTKKK